MEPHRPIFDPARPTLRPSRQVLNGWGNFTPEECWVWRPEDEPSLTGLIAGESPSRLIARGEGRSYGDAAQNAGEGVILQERRRRFLSFDANTGLLECEAGVSIAEILTHFLPRGFSLPVTPGTAFVSVGGAIAADVHGKNHHRDGSFAECVVEFRLVTGRGETLLCSRTENSRPFWATLGGMGLTGIILTASLRLEPVESAYVSVEYQKTANLEETLAAFSQEDERYRYSVAWLDSLARGRAFGRSVLMRGNPTPRAQLPNRLQGSPLTRRPGRKKSIPPFFPPLLLNSWSVRAFNRLYHATHPNGGRLIEWDRFFYPLDRIQHWNRLYGKQGFVQHQVLFPSRNSELGIVALLEALHRHRVPSFLTVLKRLGSQNEGMLSFPGPGDTLNLDIPSRPGLSALLSEIEKTVSRFDGRVYLAKDATLSREAFAHMYPRLEEFEAAKRELDPDLRFQSSLSRRLGLGESP